MKEIALLLLCAAAAAQASSSCSPDSVGVLIPHPNCDQFYMCFFGSQTELHCADGLLFNSDIQVCDWPYNVDCGDRIIPSRKLVPEKKIEKDVRSPAEICAAEDSEGFIFEHEYCDKFYKCNHGKPVTMSCAPNLLWYGPFCLWADRVDCGDRIRPEGFDKDPDNGSDANLSPVELICSAIGSHTIVVPHEDCNKYYHCIFGTPVELKCPANLFYDLEKGLCDWPENVDCSNRNKPDEINSGNPNEDKGPEHVSGGNSDPSQAPAICAAEGSDGVLVAHENCNQFYKCFAGQLAALDCPQNLLFNPEKEYCDWEWNVNCGNRVIHSEKVIAEKKIGQGGLSQSPSEICAAENSEDLIFPHEYCDKFYICNHGRPVTMQCPPKLLFSTSGFCIFAGMVNCGDRIIPDDFVGGNHNN